jgi:hypothetical protein
MNIRRLLLAFFLSAPAAADDLSFVLIRTGVPGDSFYSSREYSCSGAIVERPDGRWLVTAAHCLKGDDQHPHRLYLQARTWLNGIFIQREVKTSLKRHQFQIYRAQDFAVAEYTGEAPAGAASPGPRPKSGDRLWLVSYPRGEGPRLTICKAIGRNFQKQPFTKKLDMRDLMLCDRSVANGSSGGPVYNDDDQLVGIVSTALDAGDSMKIGYVPVADFEWSRSDGLSFKFAGQTVTTEDEIDLGEGRRRYKIEIRYDADGVPEFYYFPR